MMTVPVLRLYGIDTDSMLGMDGRITAREPMWSPGSVTAFKAVNHPNILLLDTQVNFEMNYSRRYIL